MVDAAPFAQWLRELRSRYVDATPPRPLYEMIEWLGWAPDSGQRLLHAITTGERTQIRRALVEDTLHYVLGTPWAFYEIYEDHRHELDVPLEHGWCDRCAEDVLVLDGGCAWCSTPTSDDFTAALAA